MGTNLAQRAQSRAASTRQNGGGAGTLSDQIRSMQDQFQLAMPRGAEAKQLVRDALTCIRQTPQLADCEPATVFGALMTCAQLGLRPGVLGHAWLLPFRNKGQLQAQLVVGYQGLVELAHRSGQIKSLIARTVYENDMFDVDYGLEDNLVHKPTMRGPKGQPVAYYAVAKFNTGGHAFYVMSHDEMCDYKAKNSKASKFGPWVDHFEQMAHKTCVRQLSKWMPKSTELAAGIEAEDKVRVDLSPDGITGGEYIDGETLDDQPEIAASGQETSLVSDAQVKKIHAMITTLQLPKEEGLRWLGEMAGREITSTKDLTKGEASEVIDALESMVASAENAGGDGQ